jgi:hypothetical protein
MRVSLSQCRMSSPDRSYPPGSWTVEHVREALDATEGDASVPDCDATDEWDAIAASSTASDYVQNVLAVAERYRDEPVPSLPATLYAEYERVGNRSRYENAYFDRSRRLSVLAVAECVERDGRYLDAILDHAWEICEQSTWLLPAHLPEERRDSGLPLERPPDERHLALFSARTAFLLAEVDHLLGERLNPALRRRIRDEVDERVFRPFESDADFHWREPPVGNWNAVCNVSAAMAALYLETDPDRLARLLVTAVQSLRHYLASFGRDGCTPEGLGYWNFGVGHYAMLADALDARTDGALSLGTPLILSSVAPFPLRISLSSGRYLPFSDSREESDVLPHVAYWAGDRYDVPALGALGREAFERRDGLWSDQNPDILMELVRDLYWACRAPEKTTDRSPDRCERFEDCEWWLARADPADPNGLAVGAKAGHNGEPHNHNDCGSFVVHYRGESSVTDIGFGTYDRDYFSERRYEYLTTRSLGHSVPYVNGYEQVVGPEYASEAVRFASSADRERFEMDLAGCYPAAAGIESLERMIGLDRRNGRVTVTDEALFADDVAEPTFESVLVSYAPTERTDGGVAIRGDHSETSVHTVGNPRIEVEHLDDAVDLSGVDQFDCDGRDVWRTRIAPPGGDEGESRTVELVIEPECRR